MLIDLISVDPIMELGVVFLEKSSCEFLFLSAAHQSPIYEMRSGKTHLKLSVELRFEEPWSVVAVLYVV